MKKIFSFDAETNGLWGKAWAIGALVYNENGIEIFRFLARLPDSVVTDSWVREHGSLAAMAGVQVTHDTYEAMLADFAQFYMANKTDADIIVHMGVPVEAGLLRDMHDAGFIGDFDGPYPLMDVSGNLQQFGEDPTSVDGYLKKYKLSIGEVEGGTHNPLYDSAVAAAVYQHLMLRLEDEQKASIRRDANRMF